MLKHVKNTCCIIVNGMRRVEWKGMREGEGNEGASQLGAILCMLNTNNARR
jgi:hypothetical protein